MAFALIILGVIMVTAAVRGTQHCLLLLFKSEVTGPGNFLYWLAAIIIIGIIGMSETLKPLSQGLLVLILLALFLTRAKKGLFNQLTSALGSSTSPQGSTTTLNLPQIGVSFTGG